MIGAALGLRPGHGMSLSLIGGGPLHDVAERLHLTGRGGRRVLVRLVVAWLVSWVPLLVLSAVQGMAVGDAVAVPFLHDITAQVRFLIAVPLLVVGGVFLQPRLRDAVRHLERGDLIADEARADFAEVLRTGTRLVRSRLELVILVPVVLSAALGRGALISGASSWERPVAGDAAEPLTPAGLWLLWVSLPVYRYLALRWVWRCGVWGWVLLRLSRTPLRLAPAHPDGACGLAFLGLTQAHITTPLVLSLGALEAALVGNRAVHFGVPVADSWIGILVFCAGALTFSLAPLLVFTRHLAAAKRRGLLDYAALSSHVVRAFHEAWVEPGAPPARRLLASQDVSSVADMLQTYAAAQRTGLLPWDRPALLTMLAATVTPFLPLVVSQVPPDQALQVLRALVL